MSRSSLPKIERVPSGKWSDVRALQMLRAIAALLVVVWHSELVIKYMTHNYWPGGSEDFRAANYPSMFNHLDLGIDIFFCISGYIMALLVERANSGGRSAKDFAVKRMLRIFPPYWLFTLIVVIVFYFSAQKLNIGQLSGDRLQDSVRLAKSLFLIPQSTPPVLGVGWTLVYEAQFYLFCVIIIYFGLKRWFLELLFLSFLVGLVVEYPGYEIGHGYVFSTFNAEFFFGALVFRFQDSLTARGAGFQLALAILTFVLLSFALDVVRPADGFVFSLTRKCGGGLLGALLISSLIGLDKHSAISWQPAGRLLVRIGNASYTLYLAHWFILSPLGRLLALVPDLPTAVVACAHFACIALCVAICVLLAEKLELPFHRYLARRWSVWRAMP